MPRRTYVLGFLLFLLPCTLTNIYAEPVDKNRSGGMTSGRIEFGQARSVGDSTPGVAWLMLVEPGYGLALSTWNRLEVSAEIGTGYANFKRKSTKGSVNLPIKTLVLAKAAYGYTVGENVFGLISFGAGPAMAKYNEKYTDPSTGAEVKITEDLTGFAGTLGLDVVFPASEQLRLFGGAHFKMLTFNGDKAPTMQLNMPMVAMGAGYMF